MADTQKVSTNFTSPRKSENEGFPFTGNKVTKFRMMLFCYVKVDKINNIQLFSAW